MNKNHHVIHTIADGYGWWRNRIVRILIPGKVYFYHLFINRIVVFYRYVPLRPYMNNTGFRL